MAASAGAPDQTTAAEAPAGGGVYAIGDSITAHGAAQTATGVYVTELSWLMGASMLARGRIVYAGASATSGYTISGIRATHLPNAIAAAPGYCLVETGRNDVSANSPLTTMSAGLAGIYDALVSASIVPIVTTVTPRALDTPGQRLLLRQLNDWLRTYARRKGYPLVDLFPAVVDPATGNLRSGYTQDGTHPTGIGAGAMGQAVSDALDGWLTPGSVPLARDNNATGSTNNLIENACMLVDSNGDGLPDGWTAGGTSVVYSLEAAAAPAVGNFQGWPRRAAPASRMRTRMP